MKNGIAEISFANARIGPGIPVPPGFVITAETYRKFITETGIVDQINKMLATLNINNTSELQQVAEDIKNLIVKLFHDFFFRAMRSKFYMRR